MLACSKTVVLAGNMKRHHFAVSVFALTMLPLSGCLIVPDYIPPEVTNVFPRVDEQGVTNQVVIETKSCFGWYGLAPDGGDPIGSWKYKRRYYFREGQGKRKRLPFLRRKFDVYEEFCVPVEGTNHWVRVEGPQMQGNDRTNGWIITVFTPKKQLYEHNLAMTDRILSATNLHFEAQNRLVTYKSDHDGFVYDVLKDTLSSPAQR